MFIVGIEYSYYNSLIKNNGPRNTYLFMGSRFSRAMLDDAFLFLFLSHSFGQPYRVHRLLIDPTKLS